MTDIAARPVLPAERSRVLAGIGIGIAGYALFSVQDVFVKVLTGELPLVQILFMANLVALVPLAVMTRQAGGLPALRVRHPGWQILRATLFLGTGLSYFFAFSRMPLADVYAIAFSAPLLITALSGLLLGEKVGWRRWAAVAAGFVGVLVMQPPGAGLLQPGVLWAVGGTLCLAFNMILVRRTADTDGPVAMMAYNLIVGLVGTGVLLPFGFFEMPTPTELGLLLCTGLLAALAQISQIQGFRLAPAAAVAPFQYTQMFWGLVLGYLVFGDLPSRLMLVGVTIVIASGLYILWREARRREAR